MSYILDALKKSEQERQRRSAPGIHTEHAPPVERRKHRALWPYLLTLALLLNAGSLLWWLQPWKAPKSVTVARGPGHEAPPAVADRSGTMALADRSNVAADQPKQAGSNAPKTNQAADAPSTSVRSTLTASKPAEAPPDASQTIDPSLSVEPAAEEHPKEVQDKPSPKSARKKAPETQPSGARQPSSNRAEPPDATKKAQPQPVGKNPAMSPAPAAGPPQSDTGPSAKYIESLQATVAAQRAAEEALEAAGEPRGAEAAPSDAAPDPHPAAAQPAAARPAGGPEVQSSPLADTDSAPEKGLPRLQDLPFSIRKDLPNLSFSMLVYGRKPADRMLGINGRVMREGQEVASGLKLERITPNGAIFSYRGHRFSAGVF